MKSDVDYTKLWKRQDCSDYKFSKITGIPLSSVYAKTELSMPAICLAAYNLNCKISDLVDMVEK